MGAWRNRLGWLFVGVLVSAVAQAENDPEVWLQKLVTASNQASYAGHSVLLSNGELSSYHIRHALIDGQVWERIVHLSGTPTEIVRKGSKLICYKPSGATQLAARPHLGKLSALDQGVRNAALFYHIESLGQGRVAGREAIQVKVQPKDSFRYGYHIWLDAEAGILLKSQIRSARGQVLQDFEFVDIEIGVSLSPLEFQPADGLGAGAENSVHSLLVEVAAKSHEFPWQLKWVPQGFVLAREFVKPGEPSATARMYSDGLSAYTVFVEDSTAKESEQVQVRGATAAVRRTRDGLGVTVVGELPLHTAQKIAANIEHLESGP